MALRAEVLFDFERMRLIKLHADGVGVLQPFESRAPLEAGNPTAAVRIGRGRRGNLRAYLISELLGTAVAAPRLAADAASGNGRELPVVCLNRLERQTCETLRAAGVRIQTGRVLRVDNYMAVAQAAVEGLGVAMIYGAPGKPIEFNGRLVPLAAPIPAPFAIYFVCRAHEAEQPELAALRSWLTECILGWGVEAPKGDGSTLKTRRRSRRPRATRARRCADTSP